jgi:hypothetical protein
VLPLSQLSHRLVSRHRTWSYLPDIRWTLTCANGPRWTHRTTGTRLRIRRLGFESLRARQVSGHFRSWDRPLACSVQQRRTATTGHELDSSPWVLVVVEPVAQPPERIPGHLVESLGVNLHREATVSQCDPSDTLIRKRSRVVTLARPRPDRVRSCPARGLQF